MNERLAGLFGDMAREMAREYKTNKDKKLLYKKRAYENASSSIGRHERLITSGAQAQKEIKGIGKSIAAKIDEIIATGQLQFLEERPEEVKEKEKTIKQFEKIYGVGNKVSENWYNLGYRTIESLAALYSSMTDAQKLGYYYYHQLNERIPRSEIDKYNLIFKELWSNVVYVIAGSYRRNEPTSGDIDIVVSNTNLNTNINLLVNKLIERGLILGNLAVGPTKYHGIIKLTPEYSLRPGFEETHHARRIDIRLVNESAWPYALLYFTGSKQLNIEMRARAGAIGYTLNEYGMYDADGNSLPAKTERDIFNYLGIRYLEPNERAVMFKSGTVQSTTQQPTVSQALQPSITQVLTQPSVSEIKALQPSVSQPITQQPSVSQPITQQPSVSQPITQQPSVSQVSETKMEEIKVAEVKKISGKWHRPVASLFIYISDTLVSTGNIAAFDLDWTLVRTYEAQFPKSASDIKLLPNRISTLKQTIEKGYTIVVFTNQKSTNQKSTNDTKTKINFDRVNNFINLISDIPIILFMSISDDIYRKPNTGMYQTLQKMVPPITSAFYCGDAAGRNYDFSDSDIQFAKNLNIPFYLPEQIFPAIERLKPLPNMAVTNISFDLGRNMVLFVGMPGSGKSTYYNTYLLGYIHANQDILKTKAKVLKLTIESMAKGLNVCIDSTNPGQDRRQEFYDIANKYGYNIIVIYFVRDGHGWNKLRKDPVPAIAYSTYYKYLVEPDINNTPGSLYQIF